MAWGTCPRLAPRLAPPEKLRGPARGAYLESLADAARAVAAEGAARAGAARLGQLAACGGVLWVLVRARANGAG